MKDHTTPIELARALYAALEAGDRERLDALLHPQFEGHATPGLPAQLGGDYAGPNAMRREFWGGIARLYTAKAQPQGFHMLDDGRLLVQGVYLGTARSGGGTLNAEFLHVLGFADGQIRSLSQLTDSARWAEALRMDESAAVEYAVADGLATIRLNRPKQHNAINLALVQGVLAAVRRCADDASVRALLIAANGRSFTVGGDLPFISEGGPDALPSLLHSMVGPYHEALRLLSRLNVPVVAAVQGAAAGGGLGLLYGADIVVAADDLKLATGFGLLGLTCDGGNSWFLPRLLGPRRAAELYYENRVLGAAQALEWGLVNQVVPVAELQAVALERAQRLAAGPTRAFGEMRRLFRQSLTATLSEQLSAETETLVRVAASSDAAEGVGAFVAKRPPGFSGR